MLNVNNFDGFYDFLKSIYDAKKNRQFNCVLTKKSLKILEKNSMLLEYSFSNPVDYDFFYRITGSRGNNFIVISDLDNDFQFLLPFDVLRLLYNASILKAEGKAYGREFVIKTGHGVHKKVRTIYSPDETLKPSLRAINDILVASYASRNESVSFAYKPGKSIVDNALPHANHKYLFKLDIHNFFPSCKRKYVQKYIDFLFANCPGKEYAENLFLDIILLNGALAIGNPIAGILADTIISPVVKYISNICKKENISFTIYSDDMTFSSDKILRKKYIENIFNFAVLKYNMEDDFKLNTKKSYGQSKTSRRVTGVGINNNDKLVVKRSLYDSVRLSLHELSFGKKSYKTSKSLLDFELDNDQILQSEYNRRINQSVNIDMKKLRGQLAFMNMVDKCGKLQRLVKKYEKTLLKYDLMSKEKIKEFIK